jgi:hypothetical protein
MFLIIGVQNGSKIFWGKGHYYKNQDIKNQKEHQKFKASEH